MVNGQVWDQARADDAVSVFIRAYRETEGKVELPETGPVPTHSRLRSLPVWLIEKPVFVKGGERMVNGQPEAYYTLLPFPVAIRSKEKREDIACMALEGGKYGVTYVRREDDIDLIERLGEELSLANALERQEAIG